MSTEGCADCAYTLQLDLVLEGIHVRGERLDLLLEVSNVRRHLLELAITARQYDLVGFMLELGVLRLLEVVAAVRRIVALERQVPASLARRLPITLDLPALALVAMTLVSSLFRSLSLRIEHGARLPRD
jgi:hypothetical protein